MTFDGLDPTAGDGVGEDDAEDNEADKANKDNGGEARRARTKRTRTTRCGSEFRTDVQGG